MIEHHVTVGKQHKICKEKNFINAKEKDLTGSKGKQTYLITFFVHHCCSQV